MEKETLSPLLHKDAEHERVVGMINSQKRCQEYPAINLLFSIATLRSEPPLASHIQFYSILAPINNTNNSRCDH